MAYGVSFQPGADQQAGTMGRRTPPVQQAIKLLSLRLPSVIGAKALAPQALLQGQGSAGAGQSNALMMWLKKLLQDSSGGESPPQLSSMEAQSGASGGEPAMSSVPTPHVVPGGVPPPFDPVNGPSRKTSQPVWNDPYPYAGEIGNPWDYPAPTGGGDLPPLAEGVHRADESPFDVWT